MQSESEDAFNLIETEFQKLSLQQQKALLQILISKLGVTQDRADISVGQRVPGLQQGKVWMSDTFGDELPDGFWGGRI